MAAEAKEETRTSAPQVDASAVENGLIQVGEAPAGGVRNADDGPPAVAVATAATQ